MTTPRLAIVTEHPDIKTKCEDLSKALLVLFFLIKDGTLQIKVENKEEMPKVIEKV